MTSTDAWDFHLPEDRIATRPAERREAARLLHLPLAGDGWVDGVVPDLLRHLRRGDLLVVNDTTVMAARLRAHRATGGAVEVLLLQPGPGEVEALIRPARRLKVGEVIEVAGAGTVTLVSKPDDEGIARVRTSPEPLELMARAGELPLPPYLGRAADEQDTERYQTVFGGPIGAAAAPTAGLHFTPELLAALQAQGVELARVTLHVGIGTFRPLRDEDIERGTLHAERYLIPPETAAAVARTRAAGGRVIAVGTTSARALESAASQDGALQSGWAITRIFISPPYRFRAVDGMLTNFHLPRSSLLMLVASLTGRERLLAAYAHAVQSGYRFYSYGDAMLLL